MDWNLGALITLGVSFVGSIVWIIRLEGRVKMLEKELSGERGIYQTLKRIEDKQDKNNDKLTEIKTQLSDLLIEHNRYVGLCREYRSGAIQ